MVRQARSGVTRSRIINSAVDLFVDIGYPATGLGDIIERAEMTKGAFYYHFDSKEALASTIIEEAGASLLSAFSSVIDESSPTLEGIIHGVFVATDHFGADKVARTGTHLLRVFGGFNPAAGRTYAGWSTELTSRIRQAGAEGDLREDIDPKATAEVIIGSLLGAELSSHTASRNADLRERVAHTWALLLPAIVTTESLGYFREYLSRESLRAARASSTE